MNKKTQTKPSEEALRKGIAEALQKADRFVRLYLESEHDGEDWGSSEAADRRASELREALDHVIEMGKQQTEYENQRGRNGQTYSLEQ